jgi:epoxyqueuosine reductase
VGVEAVQGEDASLPTGPLHPGTDSPPLIDLLTMALDEARWESFSRGSAIRRAGREGFTRNVCVALGNWGAPEAASILSAALADPSPLVREHAEWALERIAGGNRSATASGKDS